MKSIHFVLLFVLMIASLTAVALYKSSHGSPDLRTSMPREVLTTTPPPNAPVVALKVPSRIQLVEFKQHRTGDRFYDSACTYLFRDTSTGQEFLMATGGGSNAGGVIALPSSPSHP